MKKLLGLACAMSIVASGMSGVPAFAHEEESSSASIGTSADFGNCAVDPVYERALTGTVTTGARVRNVACMDGSTVLTTLATGTVVKVIGETDGWWKIKLTDGTEGWVGQSLMSASDKEAELTETPPIPTLYDAPERDEKSDAEKTKIRNRVKGHILLQVEKHGEAWYVDEDGNRTYMKDGDSAYGIMREKGLGISENDFKKLDDGDASLKKRLLGRIILRVHKHGEAYYINPEDQSVTYLKDGPAAYELMRKAGLGVTDSDLSAVPESTN